MLNIDGVNSNIIFKHKLKLKNEKQWNKSQFLKRLAVDLVLSWAESRSHNTNPPRLILTTVETTFSIMPTAVHRTIE